MKIMDRPSGIPTSKTKIIVPRRREGLLTRPRLLDLLAGILEKKLFLISASAGYGKTSLLVDFAVHTDLPVCWLSLDELDRDPQHFVSNLIACISYRFPEFGAESRQSLANLTSEHDIQPLAITLSNEAYQFIHEHFVLILDDYHLIEDVAPIRELLSRFAQLADENCHIIIASRNIVKLPILPVFVVRQQVDGLDYNELAFRADEIQALLAHSYHHNISAEQAGELAEATEGWITSLQFSGVEGIPDRADRARLARVTGVDAFDYLGQQVLDQQPLAVREFLLQSAMLEEYNESFCRAILSPIHPEVLDWTELMNIVQERNLFVQPVGEDGSWLRYHHLFRDFLQTRLKLESPEIARKIQIRLAEFYEGHKEWQKAYSLHRELGEAEALADMIERAGPTLLVNAVVTLEGWLDALPPSVIRARPALLSLSGCVTYMKGDLRAGLNLLTLAESAFRSNMDATGLSRTLARRTVVHRYLGDYVSSVRDAEEVLRLSETLDELQDVRAEALRAIGLSQYHMGEAKRAVQSLERSLAIYSRLHEVRNIPILLMETGMAYSAIGEYKAAETSYKKALDIWRKEGNLSWQANLLNNLGVLYHYTGQYEKAALAYEEGLTDAQNSHYTRMEAYLRSGLGDLYAELEEYDAAAQSYREAEQLTPETGEIFLYNYLPLAQANLALLRGNFPETHQRLESVEKNPPESFSHFERGLLELIRGRLLLSEGYAPLAIMTLSKSEKYLVENGRDLESAWSRLWLAAALMANGDKIQALNKMEEALSVRKQAEHSLRIQLRQARGWLTGLERDAKGGGSLLLALREVRQLDVQLPQARRKLRLLAHTVEMPVPHITIQALGKAQVLINGEQLHSADWQPQAARLFFYFLSLRVPVTKEQACNALWPDLDDPDTRFKNFLYRLRRVMGQQVILFENDLYYFNRSLDFDYDGEAFDALLTRARAAASPEEELVYLRKATDLVRGHFLEDIDAVWVTAERARLDQAFLGALVSIAELYWRTNQYELALQACQRVKDHDPCTEAAYRVGMRIHHAQNNRHAITLEYEACRLALLEDLGLTPSEETETLYRQLIT
jgi:LuxR family transcriptional regulator, maltose regulon positive regulatory protein